jgi:hypothetical protein
MILGYILICGMGSLEYGAIDGCKVFPKQFKETATCELAFDNFLVQMSLPEGYYIADHDCFELGIGA